MLFRSSYAAAGSKTGVENEKTEEETNKVKQEIYNLKKRGDIQLENLTGVKEDNKLKQFQNWLNDARKETNDGDRNYAQLTADKEFQRMLADEKLSCDGSRRAPLIAFGVFDAALWSVW